MAKVEEIKELVEQKVGRVNSNILISDVNDAIRTIAREKKEIVRSEAVTAFESDNILSLTDPMVAIKDVYESSDGRKSIKRLIQ